MNKTLKEVVINDALVYFEKYKKEDYFKKVGKYFKEGTFKFKDKYSLISFGIQNSTSLEMFIIMAFSIFISPMLMVVLHPIISIPLSLIVMIIGIMLLSYRSLSNLKKKNNDKIKNNYSRIKNEIKTMFINKKSPLNFNIPVSISVFNVMKKELSEHELKHLMKLRSDDVYLEDVIVFLMNKENDDLDIKYKRMLNIT